jgi:AcrR family transcriptional regulator
MTPSSPGRATPAKGRVLTAAARLFYDQGMTASGVDTVCEHAQVSKRSLYRHFPSKERLEVAYLQARHAEWIDLYCRRAGSSAPGQAVADPTEGVLAVVDAYLDHAQLAQHFRGCGLLNAAAELPLDHPGRDLVHRHKQQVQDILELHCRGLMDPESARSCAQQLSFLLEGAMSRAGLAADPGLLEALRTITRTVLQSATGSSATSAQATSAPGADA